MNRVQNRQSKRVSDEQRAANSPFKLRWLASDLSRGSRGVVNENEQLGFSTEDWNGGNAAGPKSDQFKFGRPYNLLLFLRRNDAPQVIRSFAAGAFRPAFFDISDRFNATRSASNQDLVLKFGLLILDRDTDIPLDVGSGPSQSIH
jgi:hypothetical protein